jgi:ornithine--oxo-acid transaminase
MKAEEFMQLEAEYGARNYEPLSAVLSKGSGVWLWDVDGNKYLDCLAAYGACNQGHCHPKILQTLMEQAPRLTLTSRAFRNDQLGPFYRELCELTSSHMVLPMNSGAEAVESVIKAVRKWGYNTKKVPKDKAEIIVCENNFHGRTITIVGFSTTEQYREGYGPFTPGFKIVPYGDIDALERAITPNTVAFLVEPIQAEAGIIIPPSGYLRAAKEVCARNSVVMILDEIQTGLGRTGKMLAEEHDGIQADVTLIGKALSGGYYPISAVLSSKDVLGVFAPGDHGSTFGGNPLACAVARTALRVLIEEKMIENALEMGKYLIKRLQEIGSPHVKEIRGKGLMIGMELNATAGGARHICEELLKKRILCKECHENVVRITPPLVISEKEIDWGMDCMRDVLNSL